MLKGNKGEWSEIYTLLKLLGDGELYLGDGNINRVEEIFYPIIKIIREESGGNFEYELDGEIVLISGNEKAPLKIDVAVFSEQAGKLLAAIKKENGAFVLPEIQSFLDSIYCNSLKAKSISKTDIRIVVYDQHVSSNVDLGFSIKSKLGSESTLLNAGNGTNFIFKVCHDIEGQNNLIDINLIETKSKVVDRVNQIYALGGYLEFVRIEEPIFENNLILIDSRLPDIIAELLIFGYKYNNKNLVEVCEKIAISNPLGYDNRYSHSFYAYKMKRFLTDVALGMTPSKVWDGKYQANGGYLVVKETGDVLCYHIYNKNEFENYLFNNTRLETPSTSRYNFGKIYQENGNFYFKLNLQIRFI
jgi:hypothetical protein